jgi:pyruvate/2-oxoglutarate dehydrogenase complex dihydrolipoamide dehydrogenase (E3) component
LNPHTLEVTAEDNTTTRVSADNFLIATGSRPSVPDNVTGLSEVRYHTNQTIFDLKEIPNRLLIVGGGPIGVEMAQAFRRLGSDVTLVQRAERLLPRDDAELVTRLTNLLRAEDIDIRLGTDLTRIDDGKYAVVRDASGVEERLAFDCLLLAVGRTPNVDGLALESAGVEREQGAIPVNKRLQTSASHIYACGDVIDDGYRFSHLAEYQSKIAVRNLVFPGSSVTDYGTAPWATFTEPELAHVGVTEEEAQRKRIPVDVYRQALSQNDRALTDGGSDDPSATGLVKILVEPGVRGRILGAQILAPRAGEMLQEWVLAMEQGLSIRAIADMVHVYPTLSLASQHAAQRWYERQSENPLVDRALAAYIGKIRPREKTIAAGVLGVVAAGILVCVARWRGTKRQ